MNDRVILQAMRFMGRHGLHAEERVAPQPIEVDVELAADLRIAGAEDDIDRTVDYEPVFEICRQVIEESSYRLLEAVAETIAREVLAATATPEVLVRVRKMRVPIKGKLAYAAVEIRRSRDGS
ncbi:dihydroneopterin aldolase [soil metagenome]|jgi:dihydroneopterin aldolase